MRLDRIGDVLLSTPVIKAVRDACPGSHIAVMVRPYARQIVEGNPYLNEVIAYDKEGSEKSLAGNLRFIKSLRNKGFDIAIALHPTTRTHIAASLAGIPVRIGYDRKYGFLLTRRVPHTKQFGLKHEIDYALDLLRYIGLSPSDRALYMPVTDGAERKMRGIFAENGIREGDLVVAINPGASCPSKRWRGERFAEAASELTKKHGAKIVVVSGPGDRALGDNVAALIDGRCLNLSGKTEIADLAAVLKLSDLFISNDSGPVHIACALGTPVVAIFGRSDAGLSPRRWGPTGKRDIVLHKDVGCGLCLAHNCAIGFKCLDAVTVDEVVAAAERLLQIK